MRKLIFLLAVLTSCAGETTDKKINEVIIDWELVNRVTNASLRGLDVGADGSIWASGTGSTVLKSLDKGKTWEAFQVDSLDLDFRDIEAFDQNHACVMSAGNGVKAYSTIDGGATWNLAYEDMDSSQFFDGMDFLNGLGYAFGDPQSGRLNLLKSQDSGRTWSKVPELNLPTTIEGEAGYAASGTGIVLHESGLYIATGGGKKSRLLINTSENQWTAIETPISSSPGTGIFSMCVSNDKIHVVGGSYVDSTNTSSNAAYCDSEFNWSVSNSRPRGYRSCVASSGEQLEMLITCGRTGCDYSLSQGESWESISDEGLFACAVSSGYAIGVGRNGKVGRISLRQFLNLE